MPQTIPDVKLTVRDLIQNTLDSTSFPVGLDSDDIHTGWYDNGKSAPQISVTNDEESPFGGGETGFSAIDGSGQGGIQTRSGTVLVTAWAGSRDDYEDRGLEQLQAEEMADEIERIVGQNQSPGSLRSLAVDSRTRLVDQDASPSEHSVQFELRFTWIKTPR
ncbi:MULTISPECIES: hypothetical protein [Haloarcula]|uniref:hypothetical protein n=1 Tax=Haloarcula TaxID=2237 RepID=UPI000F8F6F1D|nr:MULTISPECIES: hypothetical protein [Haloarcula]NHX41386.1 hypothetical protein [Haloarcula sp. R1-2]